MKKFTKALAAILSISMIAVAASACAGDTTGEQDLPTVGIIQYAAHPSLDNCYTGLMQGIEAAGYKDGENITIDYQNAQNSTETADQIAANMIAKNYDVIVGIATPAALAAYGRAQGTNTQVVFCAVSDPVEAGLVSDLNAPGGNCTGTSDFLPLEEQLQMIRALQPDASKIGVLYTTNESNSLSHLKRLEELAPQYGFEIVSQGVQSSSDIPQAAASLVTKVDCITNFTDNNVVTNLSTVLAQATAAGIPVYGSEIEQVKNGCLASEGLDYVSLGNQTGAMVGKILGGTAAGTIPVESIENPSPVINDAVAAQFNITIPEAYASAERVTTNA